VADRLEAAGRLEAGDRDALLHVLAVVPAVEVELERRVDVGPDAELGAGVGHGVRNLSGVDQRRPLSGRRPGRSPIARTAMRVSWATISSWPNRPAGRYHACRKPGMPAAASAVTLASSKSARPSRRACSSSAAVFA